MVYLLGLGAFLYLNDSWVKLKWLNVLYIQYILKLVRHWAGKKGPGSETDLKDQNK